MGTPIHRAMIVTGYNECVKSAAVFARNLGLIVLGPTPENVLSFPAIPALPGGAASVLDPQTARELVDEGLLSGLKSSTPREMNGFSSFLVCSCGSKAFWSDEDHQHRLEQLRHHLKSYDFEDGSSPLEWVQVAYGRDAESNYAAITAHGGKE